MRIQSDEEISEESEDIDELSKSEKGKAEIEESENDLSDNKY